MKADGSVVTWGDPDCGGDSSGVAAQLSGGVQTVVRNRNAYAAVKVDGSMVTWGDADSGGDSSGVAVQLSGGVQTVVGNGSAFAAVKVDGSVVTWGDDYEHRVLDHNWIQTNILCEHYDMRKRNFGGDSSAVAAQLSGCTSFPY